MRLQLQALLVLHIFHKARHRRWTGQAHPSGLEGAAALKQALDHGRIGPQLRFKDGAGSLEHPDNLPGLGPETQGLAQLKA